MKLPQPLYSGKLLKRYKRFLADVELTDGRIVTAHCPNSGSMKTCSDPGSPVLLSRSDNPRRKLKYTWELIFTNNTWVGINTHYPNRLAKEAIESGVIKELQGYEQIRSEVRYGQNSRIDLLLNRDTNLCYVEIKNVTLVESDVAYFPDAVTLRGQKHLRELMQMVREGHRAVTLFIIQRTDCHRMAPADNIDPEYGKLLREAKHYGVEILAYQASVSPTEIKIFRRLPVIL